MYVNVAGYPLASEHHVPSMITTHVRSKGSPPHLPTWDQIIQFLIWIGLECLSILPKKNGRIHRWSFIPTETCMFTFQGTQSFWDKYIYLPKVIWILNLTRPAAFKPGNLAFYRHEQKGVIVKTVKSILRAVMTRHATWGLFFLLTGN